MWLTAGIADGHMNDRAEVLADQVTQLRQELSLAEEGLANYQQDHQQYVEWASPQLERLGREMQENERLREALQKWDRNCACGCTACEELYTLSRSLPEPQTAPQSDGT